MADKDYEYYVAHDFTQYAGEWIAIVGQKVVAHDVNFKKAIQTAKQLFPSKEPLLACVPRSDMAMIL